MDSSARTSKAEGEKSRSHSAQPTQRSVMVMETVLPSSREHGKDQHLPVCVSDDHGLTVGGHLLVADGVVVGVHAIITPARGLALTDRCSLKM